MINKNPIQCFNSILALKNIKLIINNNTNSYTANNLKYPGCEELFITPTEKKNETRLL